MDELGRQVAAWQSGVWSLTQLVDVLGVRLVDLGHGRALLGLSSPRDRVVGLNARILDSPLELPVLAHELAHVLLEHPGLLACRPGARPSAIETEAWRVGAAMAVPRSLARAVLDHRATVAEVAELCAVPDPFVRFRVVQELPGAGVRERGLGRWLRWLDRAAEDILWRCDLV